MAFPKDSNENPNEPNQHVDAAMEVLAKFVENYHPAETKDKADTFLSTKEIIQSIADLTGTELAMQDVFEMMNNMGYKYDAINGIEMNWLLIKN